MRKNILLLLALTLILLSSVPTVAAIEKLDISVMNGTAIPYAKEDHLAYGIVKIWNKASPITITVSLTPDRNHLDDNKYWGNYKEVEDIKIGANELRIQIFCFTVPAGSELGQQTWTLNITEEGETVTKKVAVNLPVTKNVEITTPSWKPDILKLELPLGKPDTFTVKEGKPTMIVALLDIAGDFSSEKTYDVELDAPLPDIFFSYPEEITVGMSRPNAKDWDFKDQEFFPYTVIPVLLLVANVPYSVNEDMYELELRIEKKGTDLKAVLPFRLVLEFADETEAIEESIAAVTVNETANNSEIAAVTETAVAVNHSEVVKPAGIPRTEKINSKWWSKINQINDEMWNFIISKI